jgi:YD repeat-containing protein
VESVSDSRAVVTNFTNDSFGKTTSVGNPDAGTTNYVFDVAGRLSTETHGNLSNAYGWDALGRVARPL